MIIEGQDFSRSYDLAPRTLPPPSLVSKLDRRHTGRLREERQVAVGWGEARHTTETYDSKKASLFCIESQWDFSRPVALAST
jgi:hypothetical protein